MLLGTWVCKHLFNTFFWIHTYPAAELLGPTAPPCHPRLLVATDGGGLPCRAAGPSGEACMLPSQAASSLGGARLLMVLGQKESVL